jgi:plasmid stabilization system protein ParE
VSKGYQLAEAAQRQVHDIGVFVAEDSIGAALKVYDALEEAFELLAENPGVGHTREDLTDRPLRFWSVFSYLVVYDPASAPLTVEAVLHGARAVAKSTLHQSNQTRARGAWCQTDHLRDLAGHATCAVFEHRPDGLLRLVERRWCNPDIAAGSGHALYPAAPLFD